MYIKGKLLDAQIESFTTLARPDAGKVGRVIYDTDLDTLFTDNGAAWVSLYDQFLTQFNGLPLADQASFRSKMHAIGSIQESFLSEAQFQDEYDTKWVLADGRSAVGTDYGTLTGELFIPDLRGVFLRGKNNGRADGNENPDGEIDLYGGDGKGTVQEDRFESHSHTIHPMGSGAGANAPYVKATDVPQVTWATATTNETGGNETRPKNITVNYFFKVNR